MTQPPRRIELLGVLALASAYFAWFAWPIVWSASADRRLVGVFNVDEAVHLKHVKAALERGSFRIEFGSYGHLYFNLALAPLHVWQLFGTVSEQLAIVTLRLIPAVFAAATVVLVFAMARRYSGRLAGWLAAVLMAVASPAFLEWSVTSHPDVPQGFFFLLGAYFCCRVTEEGRATWVLWAAAAAGLAFACKYSGGFLLPVIWGCGLLACPVPQREADGAVQPGVFTRIARWLTAGLGAPLGAGIGVVAATCMHGRTWNVVGGLCVGLMLWALVRLPRRRLPGVVERVNLVAVTLCVFVATFFVTSPYSFVDYSFVRGIVSESEHVATGHTFVGHANGLRWLAILKEDLGIVLLAVVAASGIGLAWDVARKGWRRVVSAHGVLWACSALFLGFLMVRVRLREPRYLVTVLPLLVVLAAEPVGWAVRCARSRWPRRRAALATGALVAAIGALVLPRAVSDMSAYRRATRTREQASAAVAAGRWLEQRFPPSTSIFYDRYSYVPPSFESVAYTFGGTLPLLRRKDADVVIVHEEIAKRFADLGRAQDFVGGPEKFRARHRYYEALRGGEAGYKLVRDFGEVQVYERARASRTADGD